MTVVIHADSHADHGLGDLLAQGLLAQFADRTGFFIATIDLAATDYWKDVRVPVALVGPANGDPPVPEELVEYRPRPPRPYNSRMLKPGAVVPRNPTTSLVTVIAGPHDGLPCVLYTAFGGPLAPREPDDPGLPAADRPASVAFWTQHALADG